MERTMSVEEKIRRAEEIYNRRKLNDLKYSTARVNVSDKKDFKLFKRMILQIIVCLTIYAIFYICTNNNYIFSNDLKEQTKKILEYDTNFTEIYNTILEKMKIQEKNEEQNKEKQQEIIPPAEENIGGADESLEQTEAEDEKQQQEENQGETTENAVSQMEQDAIDIKNAIKFIVPITGTITSTFGWRNPTTSTVPKYHTGLDIAATTGTVIKSATDGTVILNSSQGDYGNHLKIQNGDVVIIYAHCNKLYVNEGDIITQGQEIAEVGSTGNSTGPHLHFEIRKEDRLVDPQLILEI